MHLHEILATFRFAEPPEAGLASVKVWLQMPAILPEGARPPAPPGAFSGCCGGMPGPMRPRLLMRVALWLQLVPMLHSVRLG